MSTFDYIIIGAGASGLQLATALVKDSYFDDKKILLVEKASKKVNDRTWCYWEKQEGIFDAVVHRTWPKIHFEGQKINIKPTIEPYTYKMIRGVDFYAHQLDLLKQASNITYCNDEIAKLEEKEDGVVLTGLEDSYVGNQVFDSRFDYQKLIQQSTYPVLQQHF